MFSRDIVGRIELPAVSIETFPLCHPDLSVNNIYVDDDYNITFIIDWAFASSVPEPMLLAALGITLIPRQTQSGDTYILQQ